MISTNRKILSIFYIKIFDFSKVFLDGLARIGGKSLTTSTCLSFDRFVNVAFGEEFG